ncbi:hypothetical protein ACQEUX_19250 [Micromonospora sp. CA-259024]|uniref:hypothetical protein n=1 Tax=Micromonospora sp. CA-259024 TaxID=3239965 RepID=UPI003D90212D
MHDSHPELLDTLADETFLWRYMDLPRFVDLLQSRELHLARADQMYDRWEGAYGPTNVAMRPEIYSEHYAAMQQHFPYVAAYARTHAFLNCWYAADCESASMWSIYDRENRGVAVRTTKERLLKSLTGPNSIHGATVQYVDYSAHWIPEGNVFHPFLFKRRSFEHEREYRLLTMWSPKAIRVDENQTVVEAEPDTPPTGLREAVELAELVEAVFISPEAPGWFHQVVQRLVGDYGQSWTVLHSDLASGPIY